MIYKALLKYGYSNFSLEILEYCDPQNIIKREQYYLDKLNPEYNLLKFAGSSLGFKHSAETLAKLSAANTGKNHPMFGKARPEGAGKSSKRIEVLNILTNENTVYDSVSLAAKAIDVKQSIISIYIKKQKPYKKKYIFKFIEL